ncbi:MAG: sulfatase-like hydrolase/transferase, partial [Planctomycetaceae bacterium]|nr:sulfatase-like hydrolase/transferase [Planctomycetaceae bacterium]
LLSELEARGELDNTIVVVSGDHGAPGFPRGKCNLYDFGSQVLLAIRWPNQVATGRRVQAPVSLIDLGPTFLEAAGLAATADMNGHSLIGAMTTDNDAFEQTVPGEVFVGRENHVDEARPEGLPYPMRSIRTRDYLFVMNFHPERWPVAKPPLNVPLLTAKGETDGSKRRMDIDFGPTRDYFVQHEQDESLRRFWDLGFGLRPAEELYVIANDPDQMNNVAGDPNYATVRDQLRQRLLAELEQNRDPRIVDPDGGFDRPPYLRGDPQRGQIAEE